MMPNTRSTGTVLVNLGKPTPYAVGSFVAEFDRRGIPYWDLTPFFQEEARRGKCLFFEVDGHPNLQGSRLIAKALLHYLRSRSNQYGSSAH